MMLVRFSPPPISNLISETVAWLYAEQLGLLGGELILGENTLILEGAQAFELRDHILILSRRRILLLRYLLLVCFLLHRLLVFVVLLCPRKHSAYIFSLIAPFLFIY